jgi:hypothetical protein
MHDQIDGAPATLPPVPVHKLGAVDRKHALGGMPLVPVAGIGGGAPEAQDGRQGKGSQ